MDLDNSNLEKGVNAYKNDEIAASCGLEFSNTLSVSVIQYIHKTQKYGRTEEIYVKEERETRNRVHKIWQMWISPHRQSLLGKRRDVGSA